ncbi:MAG: universal stress protein [bacterium]|nr:universal stress protein [bacterium]
MLEFNRVLIPVDFSDHSKRSLEACSKIFSEQHTREFHFVYVWRPPSDAVTWDDPQAELEQKLAEFTAGFSHSGEYVCRNQFLSGHPAIQICKYAREHKCDLIVLSTHGRTGLSHLFIGSTAEQVVRHAPCAVLTLPVPRVK